jgi:hypothetical protein
MRLVQAIIDFLYDNNSKNYNIIRPEETRHFPATIDSPGTPESYTEFAAMLERAHKIHLDQNALPRPTSNTDSQRARYHPSDFWFYKAIIRVRETPYRDTSMTKLRSLMLFITAPLPRKWQKRSNHQTYERTRALLRQKDSSPISSDAKIP